MATLASTLSSEAIAALKQTSTAAAPGNPAAHSRSSRGEKTSSKPADRRSIREACVEVAKAYTMRISRQDGSYIGHIAYDRGAARERDKRRQVKRSINTMNQRNRQLVDLMYGLYVAMYSGPYNDWRESVGWERISSRVDMVIDRAQDLATACECGPLIEPHAYRQAAQYFKESIKYAESRR